MTKKIIIVSLTILALFTTGAVVYLRKQFPQKLSANNTQTITTTTTQTKSPASTSLVIVDIHPGMKLYRNEEFGFEFEYPKNWELEANSFKSPFSKFNLQGDVAAKDYNPLIPTFLINIVTPDFVDRQFSDLRNVATETIVGAEGTGFKYEYEAQYGSYKVLNITIILPIGQDKMILRMHKEHENTFNQILSTFKFLK